VAVAARFHRDWPLLIKMDERVNAKVEQLSDVTDGNDPEQPMGLLNTFQRVSQSPTNPHPAAAPRTFDVADLYRGPVSTQSDTPDDGAPPLDEKLRQSYFWIVNTAIISPHYDVEYNDGPPQAFVLGGQPESPHVAVGAKLFELRAFAAADFRDATEMSFHRRPGSRKNRERNSHGGAGRLFRAGCQARDAARPSANDHRRFARQSASG
jgi:hypothetical protein